MRIGFRCMLHRGFLLVPFVSVALAWPPPAAYSEPIPRATVVSTLDVPDEFRDSDLGVQVSGVFLRDNVMLLAVDEGRQILVLKEKAAGAYEIVETPKLLEGPEGEELDLEGLAGTKKFIYAIGSHSRKRKSVKTHPVEGKTAKKNRARLYKTATEPSREHLFRFEVEENGRIAKKIEVATLKNLFATHPILRLFQAIPGKENGIDIEGIAIGRDNQVYIGFRGPVLRGGYVPVLIVTLSEDNGELEAAHDAKQDIRFVYLAGRGVRDMVRISEPNEALRFLILAGPMADEPGSYQVYEWDGHDTVPGRDKQDKHDHAKLQCEIPPPKKKSTAKAEGIALIKATSDELRFLIVYDSVRGGAPTIFSCPRAHPSGAL